VRSIVSTIITKQDILKYFHTKDWREPVIQKSGMIVAETKEAKWLVELEPYGDPLFTVTIYAIEDDNDRDEETTDKPIEFIEEFVQGDAPRVSSTDPTRFAFLLRYLADRVSSRTIGPKALSKIMRRASLPNTREASFILSAFIKMANFGVEETRNLSEKLQKKGWKVEFSKNESGIPTLNVDILKTFRADIEIASSQWHFWFTKDGKTHEGVSEDPIDEFEKYSEYGSKDTRLQYEIPKDKDLEKESVRKVKRDDELPGKKHENIPKDPLEKLIGEDDPSWSNES